MSETSENDYAIWGIWTKGTPGSFQGTFEAPTAEAAIAVAKEQGRSFDAGRCVVRRGASLLRECLAEMEAEWGAIEVLRKYTVLYRLSSEHSQGTWTHDVLAVIGGGAYRATICIDEAWEELVG